MSFPSKWERRIVYNGEWNRVSTHYNGIERINTEWVHNPHNIIGGHILQALSQSCDQGWHYVYPKDFEMEDIQVLPGIVFKDSVQLPINLLRDSNHNIYKTIEFQRDGNPTNVCIAPQTNL